jgi:hypothetical protein
MTSKDHPEQGFRTCMGIMRLGKTFGNDRLENAAQRALAANILSFKGVELILKNKLDQRQPEKPRQLKIIIHSNIRGASSFITQQNDKGEQ